MKLATIGSGKIVDTMFKAIEDIDGIEPVAVYSRTQQKADEFAKKHQVPKAYSDMDQMLADDEIDTVYIATPNALHYPQAKKALEAGKHVILEKPFTTSVEQAEDLFETAEKNGKMIFEAITSIHTPNYGLMKDNLSLVGTPRQGLFNYSQYSSRYDKFKEGVVTNAFDPAMDGGALTDINLYNIYLAAALFGMPEGIAYYPVYGFNGIDTSGSLILQYPNFVVTCIGSKDSSSENIAVVQGDEGTLKVSEGSTGRMMRVDFEPVMKEDEHLDARKISIDQGLHMTYEFMDFLTALNENNQEMYNACKEATLNVQKILEEAKRQRDEGRPA